MEDVVTVAIREVDVSREQLFVDGHSSWSGRRHFSHADTRDSEADASCTSSCHASNVSIGTTSCCA